MIDTSTKEITFSTNSAVKQVYLDDNLYKSLPIHYVNHQKYEVARLRATLKTAHTEGALLDTLTLLDDSDSSDY